MTKREKKLISENVLNCVVFSTIKLRAIQQWTDKSEETIRVAEDSMRRSSEVLKSLGIEVPPSWDFSYRTDDQKAA